MRLEERLALREEDLLKAWFDQLLGSYPPEARKYFDQVDKTFTNPIGANIFTSLQGLFHELVGDTDENAVLGHLGMILRIKAVQDVRPSQAVAFIPALKGIIRQQLSQDGVGEEELRDFFDTLDTLGLWAFDVYAESRDTIYELRIKQIKETNDILQKANLLNEHVDTCTFMRCGNYIDSPAAEEN